MMSRLTNAWYWERRTWGPKGRWSRQHYNRGIENMAAFRQKAAADAYKLCSGAGALSMAFHALTSTGGELPRKLYSYSRRPRHGYLTPSPLKTVIMMTVGDVKAL